jgi:uncharacterized integral membrane protein
MAYKGTSKIVAKVSVGCEICENSFTYNHTLSGHASSSNEGTAIYEAHERLKKQMDRIAAGNFDLIAEHKPCPQCGYVQSWMILPVRKHRGNNWGCALSAIAFLIGILLIILLQNTSLRNDYFGMFLVFGVPLIIYFIGRTIGGLLYMPNKGRDVPHQTKSPNITFQAPLNMDGSGEWKCAKCGGANPAKRKTCLGCNAPNPS